jgi:hypothetical protein
MSFNLECNDEALGAVRLPSEIRSCEDGRYPVSRYTFDQELIDFLRNFEKAAQSPIFRHAALEMVFIWAVDEECRFHIAIEELAVDAMDGLNVQGVPRPRKLAATQNFKKLGHPTILVSNKKLARIAGELYLVRSSEEKRGLIWGINAESGRYCGDLLASHRFGEQVRRPTVDQLRRVAKFLVDNGLEIADADVDTYRCR